MAAAALALLAACDLPRRVVPEEVSAPPLAPGSIEVEPIPPGAIPALAAYKGPTPLPPADLDGFTRIDLSAGMATPGVTIEVNDPLFVPGLGNVFDGNVASLTRTESINPLVIVFRFESPIRLRAVRIYLAGSHYDWSLEAPPGERREMTAVPERRWSQFDLPEAVVTDEVRVEARRLERDDYVHLNELELWVEP